MAVSLIIATYMCILHIHLLGYTKVQADPCVEGQYTIIDDVRRRPIFNPGQLCDDKLSPGWYRFLLNGTDAEIPTSCVESKSCGTFAPVWLRLPAEGLPLPGKTRNGEGCANYEDCCAFSFPVVIKNCRDFFIYRLEWIYGCPVAYCAYTPLTTCSQGQIYIRHLHSCIDHIVEITKPVIRVRVKGSSISLNCTFHIPNDVIASTSPTFHVVWYKGERGLSSIIRKTFRTDTSDAIRVGNDVYAGRSITCAVQPVSGVPSGEISSDPYFLGVKIQDGNVTLTEDGPVQNLTWVSRLPILCNKRRRRRANSCGANLIFRLGSHGEDRFSKVSFSSCKIPLRRVKRCPRNICALDQIQVGVARNLYNLEPEEYDMTGDIYFQDGRLWGDTLSKTYITVYDLPSATCFAVSGVQLLTFSSRKERIMRRGTYVLFQSVDSNIEIHMRVGYCLREDGLCICGVVLRYRENVVTIDTCRQNTRNENDDIEVDFRLQSHGSGGPIVSNMKVLEGRNNRLIHILLNAEARVRVDINSGQIGVAVHVSGYYTGKAEGLCGPITSLDISSTGPEVNRLPAPPTSTNSWRFAPGRSYFDRPPTRNIDSQFDITCDCSLATAGNPCPEMKPFLTTHPFKRFKDVTNDWWNSAVVPPDYRFSGDEDVADVDIRETVSEATASERCGEFLLASDIADTCTDFINEKIQIIIELCITMAMVNDESSWKPNILRLTESICESTLVSKPFDIETNASRDSYMNVTLCPGNCYNNGFCSDDGCICYYGFQGVECLTSLVSTTTSTSTTTPTTTTTTTTPTTTTTTTTPTTTTTTPTTTTTTTPITTTTTPTTTTTTTTPTTTTTTPMTTKTTPTTTVSITTPTTTPSSKSSTTTVLKTTMATTPRPVLQILFTTCERRTGGCGSVRMYLKRPLKNFSGGCAVRHIQFKDGVWVPSSNMERAIMRYINIETVECMLPEESRGTDFTTYQVYVFDSHGHMSSTMVSAIDSVCQTCSMETGCSFRENSCFIDDKCFNRGETNTNNHCLQCLPAQSVTMWSPREDNRRPVARPKQTSFSMIQGDTIYTRVNASDPEGSPLSFKVDREDAYISRQGMFKWKSSVRSLRRNGSAEVFRVSITDKCGGKRTVVLLVVLYQCGCKHHGECVSRTVNYNRTANSYECNCPTSYTGSRCESRVSACRSNPCYQGVTCSDVGDGFRCGQCPVGMTGNGITCDRSCASKPCFPGVQCRDMAMSDPGFTHNAFACGECPPNYLGDGQRCKAQSANMCERNVCSPLTTCRETRRYPYYKCSACPYGYLGNGTTCTANTCNQYCPRNRICVSPGVCACRQGYTGFICHRPVCNPHCLNMGFCQSVNKCLCRQGYTGARCETAHCNPSCINNGLCIRHNKCRCHGGYGGYRCEIPVCNPPCKNGGACLPGNKCRCTPNYKGKVCNKPKCSPKCQHGGKCVSPGVCRCRARHRGPRCERAVCRFPCQNGGVCSSYNRCQCRHGFHGRRCQFAHCRRVCLHGGRCVGVNHCTCIHGYTGRFCQRVKCTRNCNGRGYCRTHDKCTCRRGYYGPNCQYASCWPRCPEGQRCPSPSVCRCRRTTNGHICQCTVRTLYSARYQQIQNHPKVTRRLSYRLKLNR
ncbi:uncharacterized protein LOC117318039 [Pecten maximus]|uniref:uncharacterized protein LOC117318039 n=1 Tax=Pecten maximus TaxID=6579 RepID=UPI001457F61E|nr:uncharacterized protein LOC117318039 [Pecten maximus]